MTILITGGAGYIGSHTVRYFIEKQENVIVVDNLQNGHKEAIKDVKFYNIDLRDQEALEEVFQRYNIEAVIHFAANSIVAESVDNPFIYYHNNLYSMMCLLNVMMKYKVSKIVFSSTAATYGDPSESPILENSDTKPTNPYGETKLAMEKMIGWFEKAYGIKYVSLRYFNAAGAHKDGSIGEDHEPETHLIPLILDVALRKRKEIFIFGQDYPTRDGTCIRDYIHVMDLAKAHYLSLEYLRNNNVSDVFNLGNGNGYSVNEVIEVARKITKKNIPAVNKNKRVGDPPTLIASSQKAQQKLGWRPSHSDIEEIIADAWRWHKAHPNGYKTKRK